MIAGGKIQCLTVAASNHAAVDNDGRDVADGAARGAGQLDEVGAGADLETAAIVQAEQVGRCPGGHRDGDVEGKSAGTGRPPQAVEQ